MNELSLEEQFALHWLVLEGKSVRRLAAETGYAKATVMKYRALSLEGNAVLCACGKPVKHQGWCRHRMTGERKKVMRGLHSSTCIDCGGKRHMHSGLRCMKCHQKRIEQRILDRANETRPCRMCGTTIPARVDRHVCDSLWCHRLYAFYYVEGRYRPSTARGGKNNELRFEYFLSDYIRRIANEQAGKEHGRSA